MQERIQLTKAYHALSYFVWKEATHKRLKAAPAKTIPTGVYVIGTTYFDVCFLFHGITGRRNFSEKINATLSIFWTLMLLLSLKPVFWKKSVFYA